MAELVAETLFDTTIEIIPPEDTKNNQKVLLAFAASAGVGGWTMTAAASVRNA